LGPDLSVLLVGIDPDLCGATFPVVLGIRVLWTGALISGIAGVYGEP